MQRLETLSTLKGIFAKIKQASDQIAIARAIKNNTGAFRNLNAQLGKIEKVENIVKELHKEMKGVDQVSEIIEDCGRETAVNEHAIDEKLGILAQQIRVNEEKKEDQEAREKLATIDVPGTSAAFKGLQITGIPELGRSSSTGPVERGDSLKTESTDAFLQMSLDQKELCRK